MKSNVFYDAKFNYGWEIDDTVTFLGKEYNIIVSAKAYFASEIATDEQENAYLNFKENKIGIINDIEKAMESENKEKFVPKFLSIQKNGDTALIFDDVDDKEGGLVACISPEIKLMDIDEYL